MDEELPLILRIIGWEKLRGGDRMTRVTDGCLCNRATKMEASIDSQISMMHDLFSHFKINPDA
jgi:hypothetical protein